MDIAYHNYRARLTIATPAQIEQASRWYHESESIARQVAYNMRIPFDYGAAVVAAFSPRVHWVRNKRMAIDFSVDLPVHTMTSHLVAATKAAVYGIDSLNGPKTNAFARAISGDEQAVTIDTWMMKAAGSDDLAPKRKDYPAYVEAMKDAALDFDLTPRTAQAIVWIVERGKHV